MPNTNDDARNVASSSSAAAELQQNANYFVRHWRGGLSLRASYASGFVVAIAVLAIVFGVRGLDVQPHPTFYSVLAMSGPLVILPAIIIWQIVGLWRAAGKHVSRGGRRWVAMLGRLAVVLIVVRFGYYYYGIGLPVGIEYGRIALGQDKWAAYQVTVLRDTAELEISGPIGYGLTNRVRTELDANPAIESVRLKSTAGYPSEARALQKLIEQRGLKWSEP